MSFADRITPKNTEEVKPGLFIQKKYGNYHHIQPAAWNGKIIWKNFLLGANPLRNFIFFMILMFIVFAYTNDVSQYKQFYENVAGNPHGYCQALRESQVTPECTPDLEAKGLCRRINPDGGLKLDFGEIEVINENTNTLPSNN